MLGRLKQATRKAIWTERNGINYDRQGITNVAQAGTTGTSGASPRFDGLQTISSILLAEFIDSELKSQDHGQLLQVQV